MKKILLSVLTLTFVGTSFAQQEGSAFTATGRAVSTTFARDYESLDINPANMSLGTGYEGKKLVFGIGEFGASAYTSILTKGQLWDMISGGGDDANFNRSQAVQDFIETGIAVNLDITPLSLYLYTEKLGGFAVNTKDRVQFFSQLSSTSADILVNGYNSDYFDVLTIDNNGSIEQIANDPSAYDFDTLNIINGISNAQSQLLSELLDGTEINVSWTREYNFGWGKKVMSNDNIELGVGAAIKYVQGFAVMNVGTDKDGNLSAFSSLSPDFGFDVTGQSGSTNPDFSSAPFFTPVGKGYGLDLGVNVVVMNKFHFGAAVNNLGSIKWTGEAYSVKDTTFAEFESGGFESYNVIEEFTNLVGDGDLFEFEPQDELIVKMASTLRLGASVDLLENKIHVGADVVIPLNDAPGNFQQPIIGLGGDFRIIKWLEIETGFNYGGNTQSRLNIPVGVTFHVGKSGTWEAGIASRDAVTWFRENSPNISMAMGLLRFRF